MKTEEQTPMPQEQTRIPDERGATPSRTLSPEEEALLRKIGDATRKAEALLEQNKLRAAEQAAQEAIRLSSSLKGSLSPSTIDVLARSYSRQGKYEQAAALFGFRGVMNLNAAVALVKTGRIAEARKSYKEAHILAYHPDLKPYMPGSASAKAVEATIFLGRGIVDFDYRRYASAAWALEHAVQLTPRNPLALWYYGKALTASHRKKEARHYYQAAVRWDRRGRIAEQARAGLAKLGSAD
jgi:tetratricopeptide (TPR) repeat protein